MSALGNALVIAGAVVGLAAVALLATGYELVLTPEMVRLLLIKGLAAAAVGLIVVGSWIGRRGRRQAAHRTSGAVGAPDAVPTGIDRPAVGGGVPAFVRSEAIDSKDRLADANLLKEKSPD